MSNYLYILSKQSVQDTYVDQENANITLMIM